MKIYLTMDEDGPEYGVSYSWVASALVKAVEGGGHGVAAEIPEVIFKPTDGFEQMDITGLIMCIGIVIEAKEKDLVKAASGGHFVTPEAMDGTALNNRGAGQLVHLINLAKPHGAPSKSTLLKKCKHGRNDSHQCYCLISSFQRSIQSEHSANRQQDQLQD